MTDTRADEAFRAFIEFQILRMAQKMVSPRDWDALTAAEQATLLEYARKALGR